MPQIQISSASPFAYEALAVDTLQVLTASKYTSSGAKHIEALITVETAQFRYTLDGTTPTNAVGHLVNPGDSIVLQNLDQIKGFQSIKVGAASAIKVTYFKR